MVNDPCLRLAHSWSATLCWFQVCSEAIQVSTYSCLLVCKFLLHNVEQSSLCSTGGPCWLSCLSIAVILHVGNGKTQRTLTLSVGHQDGILI